MFLLVYLSFSIINRTKYEEQRKLHQSNEELLESGSNGTASFSRFLSFDLTTDFCVYVHGALMLLLFTVGLSRYRSRFISILRI